MRRMQSRSAAPALGVPLGGFTAIWKPAGASSSTTRRRTASARSAGKSLAKFYEYGSRQAGAVRAAAFFRPEAMTGFIRPPISWPRMSAITISSTGSISRRPGVNYLSAPDGIRRRTSTAPAPGRFTKRWCRNRSADIVARPLRPHLFAAPAGAGFTPTPAQAAQVRSRSSTPTPAAPMSASAAIRFPSRNRRTPDGSQWDVRVNYSNTRRRGTQVDGVSFPTAAPRVRSRVAGHKPPSPTPRRITA